MLTHLLSGTCQNMAHWARVIPQQFWDCLAKLLKVNIDEVRKFGLGRLFI